MTLKQTEGFKTCPAGFLYILALSMTIKEVRAGEIVLTEREYRDGSMLFVVLQGSSEIMEGDMPTSHSVELKQVFWKNDTVPATGWVKAVELCVVAFLPEEAVREARNTFPDVALLGP